MIKNRLIFLPIFAALLGGGCGKFTFHQSSLPQEGLWTQLYRSPSRNGVADIDPTLPLRLLWQKRTSTTPSAAIIGLGEFVLVGALDGSIEGFRLSDGKGIGKIAISSKVPITCAYAPPCLLGLKGTAKNNLICYDLEKRRTRWTLSVGLALNELLVDGDRIFVAALNGRLMRVRRDDGRIAAEATVAGQFYASPAMAEGVLVIGDDRGHLRAFDADLKQLWEFAAGSAFRATAVLADGRVYAGSTDGYFYCLTLMTGELVWKINIGCKIYQSAAVGDSGVVFGGSDHSVICLDKRSGGELWRFSAGATISTAPVIAGQTVFIGSTDKNIYGLDVKRGGRVWSFTAKGRIRSNPILSNRCLVFAAEDDQLYCFAL
jgi:outer membrane protein assembly factor BamB